MNLPDRIFAIGGAGKEIAYQLLESDWIQKEVLSPSRQRETLNVTIVDTAENEIGDDLERIQELREQRDTLEEKLRDTSQGRTGDLKIKYIPITDNIQLHDRNDLIGREVVPRIVNGRGMEEENWWLDESHIDEDLNFSTGVVRKRGLGKALYYKAYAEDDGVKSEIDLPTSGEVAILTGIGGGTGSGLFIDIARDLKQQQRTAEITLFGVLPDKDEDGVHNRVPANAHAALSELEYMSVTGEDLFRNRVLLPISPTGFSGKRNRTLEDDKKLEEFDEAIVYLIASYYSMTSEGLEDPFESAPSYAPFVIGIPQVLRYNVSAIEGAKEQIDEILDKERKKNEAETGIYNRIERFLRQHIDTDPAPEDLTEKDRSDLEVRLDEVKKLLDFDLFEELEYESVKKYRGIMTDAEQNTDGDEIIERINYIVKSVSLSSQPGSDGEGYVDNTDKMLEELIETQLGNIQRRAEIIQQIRNVKNNEVENALNYLIEVRDEQIQNIDPVNKLRQINDRKENVEDQFETLDKELAEINGKIEQQRAEQQQELDRLISQWRDEFEPIFDELVEITELTVQNELDQLQAELDQFTNEIEDAESPGQVTGVDGNAVQQAVNDLYNKLDQVGIDINDIRQDINSSLSDVKTAKEAFLRTREDDDGLLDRLPLPTGSDDDKEEAQKEYQMKKTQLSNTGILSLSRVGDTLDVENNFNRNEVSGMIKKERNAKRDELLRVTEQYVDDPILIDEIENAIKQAPSKDRLMNLVEEEIEDATIDFGDLEEQREEVQQEKEAAESKLNLFEDTAELFETLSTNIQEFNEAKESAQRLVDQYDNESNVPVTAEPEEYNFIKSETPEEILKLSGDSDIAQSSLFTTAAEKQRLRASLEELVQNVYNPRYNGLRRRRLDTPGDRYPHTSVTLGIISKAKDKIQTEANLEDEFEGAFNLGSGNDDFISFSVDTGGDWDIGLVTFISGVFLDNIRPEVEPDGYLTGYQNQQESDDTDTFIHHVNQLEEGFYVRRSEVMNMENTTELEFFVSGQEVSSKLLEKYIETVQMHNEHDTSQDTTTAD